MILIADSGSTKIDWAFAVEGEKEIERFETKGFNPVYHKPQILHDQVVANKPLLSKVRWIREVHYYGAGCSNEKRRKIVQKGLGRIFTDATIQVEHDLVAAIRATYEGSPCLVGILGTGSNLCHFDGTNVSQQTPSLGYILGDEGSGGNFGRQLLKQYLYGNLPEAMTREFESREITKDLVLDKVYNNPKASEYMASFAPILFKFKDEEISQQIISKCLRTFFDHHLSAYKSSREIPVYLVGSIAFHFQEFIKDLADEFRINIQKTLKQPMDGLVDYHRQKLTEKPDLW